MALSAGTNRTSIREGVYEIVETLTVLDDDVGVYYDYPVPGGAAVFIHHMSIIGEAAAAAATSDILIYADVYTKYGYECNAYTNNNVCWADAIGGGAAYDDSDGWYIKNGVSGAQSIHLITLNTTFGVRCVIGHTLRLTLRADTDAAWVSGTWRITTYVTPVSLVDAVQKLRV